MNRKDTPAVAGARRVAKWHKAKWGKHAKLCWQCRNAAGDLHKMCNAGRQAAIDFYKARDALREAEKAEKGNSRQGELWTP